MTLRRYKQQEWRCVVSLTWWPAWVFPRYNYEHKRHSEDSGQPPYSTSHTGIHLYHLSTLQSFSKYILHLTNSKTCTWKSCIEFTFQWEQGILAFESNLLSASNRIRRSLFLSPGSLGLETAPSLHVNLATWVNDWSFSTAKMPQPLLIFMAPHTSHPFTCPFLLPPAL